MIETFLRRLLDHKDIEHEGSLYMRRFFLARLRGWELVLHKICRPDADKAHHDHPGDFATLVIGGGYIEHILLPNGWRTEVLTAGQLRFRSAEHAHRIDRILGDAAWTLCLRRRTSNDWGFWVDDPAMNGRPPRFALAEEYFRPGYDRAKQIRRGEAAS